MINMLKRMNIQFKITGESNLESYSEKKLYLNRCKHKSIKTHSSGESKVTEFDNSRLAQKNVLWLHVSVKNSVGV